MLRSVVSAALVTGLLCACSGQAPKCSDDASLGLVRDIIIEQLGADFGKLTAAQRKAAMQLTNPRAASYDEKVKLYQCEASLAIDFKSQGLVYQSNIAFQSQLDDNGKHIVVVQGLRRGDLVQMAMALRETVDQAVLEAATKSPVAPPQSPGPNIAAPTPAPPTSPTLSTATAETTSGTSASVAAPAATLVEAPLASSKPADYQDGHSPFAPSFDCAKASTGPERLICSSPQLAEADVRMSQAFRAAMSSTPDKESLRSAQNVWRKSRRDACSDVSCMLSAYKSREIELTK